MILLDNTYPLSPTTLTTLQTLQTGVDNTPSFKAKVEQAKAYWDNRTRNSAFDEIKGVLDLMCAGVRRCCYCEDSLADEIEHIYPKALYPELCFVWDNYLYACGPCNSSKNNTFAIFNLAKNGKIEHLINGQQPPLGCAVIINPRIENPMDYWELDLIDFIFRITAPQGTLEYIKADYTLDTLLRLNREVLVNARYYAFETYKSHLCRLSAHNITQITNIIRRSPHPTVWYEMKRQYTSGKLRHVDQEVYDIFSKNQYIMTI